MTSPYYDRLSQQDGHMRSEAANAAPEAVMLYIEGLLSNKIGLEPESLGRRHIAGVVRARMERSMIDNLNEYLHMLESDPDEIEKLIEDVTVQETWFFRDNESFIYLKKYLHDINPSGYKKNIFKVLSVPCSTGEEPYSIAITLLEAGLLPEHFQIDAIDINPRAIETAKLAVYGKGAFRGEKRDYKDKYFTGSEEGFILDPAIAGSVNFYRENFMQPCFMEENGPYHVIFCKNLLIYLTDDARKKIFDNIDRLLLPEGIVFTGHAELMPFLQYGYRPVRHSRSFACRKQEAGEGSASHKVKMPDSPGHLHMDEKLKNSFYNREKAGTYGAEADVSIDKIVAEANPKRQKRDNKLSISMIRKLADEGSLNEALVLCEQFLGKHKHDKEAYYLMGLINLALNIYDTAEAFFQKALYLDPSYYEALLHMKLLHEKKGDHAKASVMEARIKRFKA